MKKIYLTILLLLNINLKAFDKQVIENLNFTLQKKTDYNKNLYSNVDDYTFYVFCVGIAILYCIIKKIESKSQNEYNELRINIPDEETYLL